MLTVELLQEAIGVAERSGYRVRHEWLGGQGGGGCELKGRKILFLDLAQGPDDHLELVLDTLRREPLAQRQPMPDPLRERLAMRKTA